MEDAKTNLRVQALRWVPLALVVLGALAAIVTSGSPETAPEPQVARPLAVPSVQVSRRTGTPRADAFVEKMRALGLSGTDWHQPAEAGLWTAALGRAIGGIAVSCTIESSRVHTIERAQVDLEIYSRNYTQRAETLVDVFRAAVRALAPDLPAEQLDADVPWAHENMRMERLPGTGSRSVLRFTLTGAEKP